MTFSITSFSKTTIGIMAFRITINKNDSQNNDTQHNDTQHFETQHNDTQHFETQHNDKQHNDTAEFQSVVILIVIYTECHISSVQQISTSC